MPSEPISAEDRVRNEVRDNGAPASSMISRRAAIRIAEEHAAAAVERATKQRDEVRVDGWHAVGAPVKYHDPLDPPIDQPPDTQAVAARAQRDADRARAQRYYMSGSYETAEGESVRREFRPVGPWSAGRYEANAGIEPGRYSHSDQRPQTTGILSVLAHAHLGRPLSVEDAKVLASALEYAESCRIEAEKEVAGHKVLLRDLLKELGGIGQMELLESLRKRIEESLVNAPRWARTRWYDTPTPEAKEGQPE